MGQTIHAVNAARTPGKYRLTNYKQTNQTTTTRWPRRGLGLIIASGHDNMTACA